MEELCRLAAYQQCCSLNGWVPVEVFSRTYPDLKYVVLVTPWGDLSENICECEGYHFRGTCAHQKIATQKLCGWSEIAIRAKLQSQDQKNTMTCPKCGERSMWVFKILEPGDHVVTEDEAG